MASSSTPKRVAAIAASVALLWGLGAQGAQAALAEESGFYVASVNLKSPEFHSIMGAEGEPTPEPTAPEESAKPAPAPSPTATPSAPAKPEIKVPLERPASEAKPSEPQPAAPPLQQELEQKAPVFVAGPGSYEISRVSWNQMSAKQVCADVSVRGTGGLVSDWYLTMNAATVPFNHDFSTASYQFPTWGYGFQGGFDESGRVRIGGHNYSQWNDFSTLTGGQERTLRICNWNTPKPPTTTEAVLTELSTSPGEWSWSATYRVSPKTDVDFFSSWKVRVDVSKLNAGYRGSSPLHSSPGSSDLKITQISEDIYEVEGIGWPNMGIRKDTTIEFRLGR